MSTPRIWTALIAGLLLAAAACNNHSATQVAEDAQAGIIFDKVTDLTYPFDEQTIYWPTAEGFEFHKGPEGVTDKGYFYNANTFQAAEHGGTHLDAPYHFYEGGHKVGEIPPEQLTGPALVVDVSEQVSSDRDYLISLQDLQDWESSNGSIEEGDIVLLRTGFGRYWPDAEQYLGTAEKGQQAVASLSFPGLSEEAARWLAEERRIAGVGIDTASIDFGRSQDFTAHVALASRNVLIFENVANLDQLQPRGSYVVALPMKIQEGSGAPLRIIALTP
ncbi:MAG TPA: cyclase family protein [Acidobacteriota bacterium]|nr:cyclase family protein [Acidobacteriota bacterium]